MHGAIDQMVSRGGAASAEVTNEMRRADDPTLPPPSENEITSAVIDVCIELHRELGPGLLESVYRELAAHELRRRGYAVEAEKVVPVDWKGVRLEVGFRADLVIENRVIVELKSVERLAPVHKKQLLTYLRVADKRVGLLINFGAPLLKDGIHRVVNNFVDPGAS